MTLVLFGATGDLARSKLWPALHDLAASDRLPEDLSVLGVSRSASTEELRELAAEHGPGGARRESTERWERVLAATEVVNGAADDPALYERLEAALDGREGDRLTYLSVAPPLFAEIAGRLAGIGLGREAGPASRLVIEKPFGEDLASAHELRAALHEHFDEEQLLRIDHYLGKEAAQNLLVLRFVNGIFEPLWDRRSIESIQVTVAEDGGVDGRGDFYDGTGALRDVAQNHLLQLLALTLMDAPARVAGDELRAERLKVLRSLRPIEPADAVLGQYEGYGEEEGVADGSRTDTYAALRVEVGCVALGRRALLPAHRQAAGRQGGGDRGRVPPVAAHALRGRGGLGGRQPPDHRHPAGREGLTARDGQASRRRARARQGRAGLRRGRGRPARRAGGLRAPARGRDRRRHDVVHLQRRGRGPVGRDRPAAARAARARALRAGLRRAPSPRATSRAATADGGARSRPGRHTAMTKTRKLGDAEVFPIGLGGMPMSLSSRPPEEQSIRTIHAALDAGVNFIDTADAYSADDKDFGHNERLIAKALEGRRDGVIIATKGGHTRAAGGGWELDGRPEYIKRACEKSLRRARAPTGSTSTSTTAPTPTCPTRRRSARSRSSRTRARSAGSGSPTRTSSRSRRRRSIVDLVSVQNQLSLEYGSPIGKGEVELCERHGIAFLPWSPFGGISKAGDAPGAHDPVRDAAEAHGVSPQQVVLAWLLALSPVMIPIPGASRPESITDSVRAAELELSHEELQAIGGIAQTA